MEIKIKNYQGVQRFQEGGPMEAPVEDPNAAPVEGGAPAEGGDPTQQIMEAAMAALQNQDCNLAMQVLQALVQMMGGGAPQEGPAAPEGAAPVYKAGGRLSRWIKK